MSCKRRKKLCCHWTWSIGHWLTVRTHNNDRSLMKFPSGRWPHAGDTPLCCQPQARTSFRGNSHQRGFSLSVAESWLSMKSVEEWGWDILAISQSMCFAQRLVISRIASNHIGYCRWVFLLRGNAVIIHLNLCGSVSLGTPMLNHWSFLAVASGVRTMSIYKCCLTVHRSIAWSESFLNLRCSVGPRRSGGTLSSLVDTWVRTREDALLPNKR